jgi:hypothetical protein
LAGNNNGTTRIAVSGWRFLPHYPLSDRLSIQATEGGIHNAYLPSEYQQQWEHLFGHSQIAMVSRIDHLERFYLYMFLLIKSKRLFSFAVNLLIAL